MFNEPWSELFYAIEKSIDCENLSIDWTSFETTEQALEYASKRHNLDISEAQRKAFEKAFQQYNDAIERCIAPTL